MLAVVRQPQPVGYNSTGTTNPVLGTTYPCAGHNQPLNTCPGLCSILLNCFSYVFVSNALVSKDNKTNIIVFNNGKVFSL